MASYHLLLQQSKPRIESPAKVFAKLKCKVQRETLCAQEELCSNKEPLRSIRDKHGAGFNSPRKRTESMWMNDELRQNQKVGSYRDEVQALTLSPISSPQKNFECSYSDISSKPLEGISPTASNVTELDHRYRGRQRAFLESTAMSQPLSLDNTNQMHKEPPQIRDSVSTRTPVKREPAENDTMFSPMKTKLRKRKLEPQTFNKVSSSTERRGKERKTFVNEDNTFNNAPIKELDDRRLSADQSEVVHGPEFEPLRSIAEKYCNVTERCPPMSPAKMFAYMKEKENKKELQTVLNYSKREFFNVGKFHQFRDTPLSTHHDVSEREDIVFRNAAESVASVDQSRADSADSQSDANSSEVVLSPVVPPQPSLRKVISAKRGLFTSKNQLHTVKAGFNSPRKKGGSIWMDDELKENQKVGSYHNEVQALTLSPISSPPKNFGYSHSDMSSKTVEGIPPVTETEQGYRERQKAFLVSTAISQPLSLGNTNQMHKEPPQIRDLVSSRTPIKRQPAENDRGRSVFDEERDSMFSPMKTRLRKRNLEQQKCNKVSSSTERRGEERKTSVSEDTTHNIASIRDLDDGRFSADRSEVIGKPEFPSRPITEKCCKVIMERCPPMPQAKKFAFVKEWESKKESQKMSNSSTRELFSEGEFSHFQDKPLSRYHNEGEMEADAFRHTPESVAAEKRSSADSALSQSDAEPSEDVQIPAVPPQLVLLADPLVLNSPKIYIPKKHEAVFKRNKWPTQAKFPSESVIYLKRWFLRNSDKGLFVDGIHKEQNVHWNSNIIEDRVSNSVLKTVSGRVYILVGKMKIDAALDFPKWLLKKFANGFPPNWKALYEKFLSEARDKQTRGRERNCDRKVTTAKTKPEASLVNQSVKPLRQKPPKTPPDSCTSTSSSCPKVSRSGRVIKPPLEYWKGGRVILDAQMNVTIHECYDTSICTSDVSTSASVKALQTPVHVLLPHSEGWKQSKSTSTEEESVPLRKVKTPVNTRSRAKVKPNKKPFNSLEPLQETLSSSKEWCDRMRSSKRCPATERELYVNIVPQKLSETEKSSTQKSKTQTQDTNRHSVRLLGKKQTVRNSPESFSGGAKTLQCDLCDDCFSVKRKGQRKGCSKKGGKIHKSHPDLKSSEESDKGLERRTEATRKSNKAQRETKYKPSKSIKTSPPAKLFPKSAQINKQKAKKDNTVTPQEQDEDKWTEAELKKLQEAVSYYPKHMEGYWAKVARMVETRSAEECHKQHTSLGTSHNPADKAKKAKKKKVEAVKGPVADFPVISARAGTLKRKQQVRQYLEAMPREDVDDVFTSAFMQNKRFELPSLCPSDDQDLTVSDLEPQTPKSTCFPEVKTPQCLHITPGMMGSPNKIIDDKYVYQLQKRMKKNQFNVNKHLPPSKKVTPTPSVKRAMRRCGNSENDTFVVWEMFPENDGLLSESGEEEDFYFSDD